MAALTAALSSGAVTSAEGACLFSLPTLITQRPRHLYVSFFPKSISYSLRKFSPSPPVVAARASDWMAQQVSSEEELAAVDDVSEWINGQDDYGEEVEDDAGTGGEAEERYPYPPKETQLFVGNLPYDIDSEDLANLFEQAGVVEIAQVVYRSNTEESRGFGFVTMNTVQGAEEALKKFHKYDFKGKLLTVETAVPRNSRAQRQPAPSFKMFVSNLPWEVDDKELHRLFSQHGKVREARVVRDRKSGNSRGFGFVAMYSEAELVDAIAALDGQRWEGRYLSVTLAVDKPMRKSF